MPRRDGAEVALDLDPTPAERAVARALADLLLADMRRHADRVPVDAPPERRDPASR